MTKTKFIVWIGFLVLLVGVLIEAFPEIRHVIGGEYSTWLILFINGFVSILALTLAFRVNSILREEHLEDYWSTLTKGSQGRAEEIFRNTDKVITETKAPTSRRKEKSLPRGLSGGLFAMGEFCLWVARPKKQKRELL